MPRYSRTIWTAALVVIGDEILSGRTQDRTSRRSRPGSTSRASGSPKCGSSGRSRAIGEAVNALRTAHDYLFTTGGIGPTHDDITVDAIAAAFGVPVIVHPRRGRSLRIITATVPAGLTPAGCGWRGCRKAPSCSPTPARVRRASRSAMSTSSPECRTSPRACSRR